jgi:hypothetical protein
LELKVHVRQSYGRSSSSLGPFLLSPNQEDAYYRRSICSGGFKQSSLSVHISHPFLYATPPRECQNYICWPPPRPKNAPKTATGKSFEIICADGKSLNSNKCLQHIPYFKAYFSNWQSSTPVLTFQGLSGFTSDNLRYILHPVRLEGTSSHLIEVMDYLMQSVTEIKQTAFDQCRHLCQSKTRLLEVYKLLDICRRLHPVDVYQPLLSYAVCEFTIHLNNVQLFEDCQANFPVVFRDIFFRQCRALERLSRLTHVVHNAVQE